MISVGEESGKMHQALEKTHENYDNQVNDKLNNLGAIIQPVIMIILGAVIGALVLAMYLPIFSIGNAF